MTDNEIIKAFECCVGERVGACLDCPYKDKGEGVGVCGLIAMEDALDLIKRQKELLDAAIAGQETLQKHIEKQADELEKVRAERAVNVKAYINATAAFEAEKAEKERLLNNITDKERMVELFLKPFLNSQRSDCYHCDGKSPKECEQCHAEFWADNIINYFISEGEKWQH